MRRGVSLMWFPLNAARVIKTTLCKFFCSFLSCDKKKKLLFSELSDLYEILFLGPHMGTCSSYFACNTSNGTRIPIFYIKPFLPLLK